MGAPQFITLGFLGVGFKDIGVRSLRASGCRVFGTSGFMIGVLLLFGFMSFGDKIYIYITICIYISRRAKSEEATAKTGGRYLIRV